MAEKVIIVQQTGWKFLGNHDAESLARLVKIWLEAEGMEALMAETLESAQSLLERMEEVSCVIFISISMLEAAKQIRENHPKIKVAVYTAAPEISDDPGLVFIDKPGVALAGNLGKEFVRKLALARD